MHKCSVIILGICLAVVTLGRGLCMAQGTVDGAALIQQFLPEGVTPETAAKDQLIEAVKQALAAQPESVADIVEFAVAAQPDAAESIVLAASNMMPEQVLIICRSAMTVVPDMKSKVCQDAIAAAERFETIPATKPQREEPSPVKP